MAKRSTSKNGTDAIAMLKADHDKVKKLFKEFERLHGDESEEEAEAIARQICQELTIHATVEEEIFYPAVRGAIDDEDLLDEAEVEHASARDLIAQIEAMTGSDEKYAAKVMVLGEYVNHHIEEEQDEMFPKARRAKLDMKALGSEMLARKSELQSEMGLEEDEPESEVPAAAGKKRAASRRNAVRA